MYVYKSRQNDTAAEIDLFTADDILTYLGDFLAFYADIRPAAVEIRIKYFSIFLYCASEISFS